MTVILVVDGRCKVVGWQAQCCRAALPGATVKIVSRERVNAGPWRMLSEEGPCRAIVLLMDRAYNHACLQELACKKGNHVLLAEGEGDEVGCNVLDGRVSRFGYGLKNQWLGACLLEKSAFSLLREVGLDKTEHLLHEGLNEIVEQGITVRPLFAKHALALPVNTPKKLAKASEVFSI